MKFSSTHKQAFLLATGQALFQTVSVLVMTIGGLVGAKLSADPALATLPVAAMFLGTAVATFPASLWMARVGRRVGFSVGAGLGVLGGVLGAGGVALGSLTLVCSGTFLVGSYQGFAQFYRFAASEVAEESFKSRAISWVLAGGIVAALSGPALANFGSDLLSVEFTGSFALSALVSVAAVLILLKLRVPDVSGERSLLSSTGRKWSEIVRQPVYLIALFGAATGYGIMILAMTATPLAMAHHHHHDLSASARVIQFHVLGMFLPSFFTGHLIARWGATKIMLAGVAVLSAHVATTLLGTTFMPFAAALVFLGVGWNFLYVGGTTLLTSTYAESERGKAQATNDMTIFVVGLASSFSAGKLMSAFGWQKMNLLLLPWLFLAALALLWLEYCRLKDRSAR